jgi:ATPase family associated with various cellular activities (AAA)
MLHMRGMITDQSWRERRNMEQFDIVLALAGIALETENPRAIQQVERLRDELAKLDKDQAAKLARVLSRSSRKQSMAPMAFDEMRATGDAVRRRMPGESLTRTTPLPHDKETGAALVRVLFPEDNTAEAPVLSDALSEAISDLLSEWKRTEELARLGTAPHTRCLLYGAPGVGKTNLARYLARQLDLPLVEARLDGLVSSFLGTTARNIGALFDFANRYRCALFLDEFDAIAKARDDAQEVGEIKRVVNSLLQSIDARNGRGLTFAATNHEHLLDPAVWRRFEARIKVPKPGERARSTMLDRFAKPLRLSDVERRFLVWVTEGMSGADVEALVIGGKRFFVLHGNGIQSGSDTAPVLTNEQRGHKRGLMIREALKRQAALNGMLFDTRRRELLLGSDDILAEALLADKFTQKETGELLGLTQSAISRMTRKSRPADTDIAEEAENG